LAFFLIISILDLIELTGSILNAINIKLMKIVRGIILKLKSKKETSYGNTYAGETCPSLDGGDEYQLIVSNL